MTEECPSHLVQKWLQNFSISMSWIIYIYNIFFLCSKNFIFSLLFFFSFTILYWFCHTSAWICHRCTCVPHPELPPSTLPPRTIPLGHPSVPAPIIPLWFITGYWTQFPELYGRTLWLIHPVYPSLHLLIPVSTPSLSHHPPPWQPKVYSLRPWFCLCFMDRLICVIFKIPHRSNVIWYLSSFSDLILLPDGYISFNSTNVWFSSQFHLQGRWVTL